MAFSLKCALPELGKVGSGTQTPFCSIDSIVLWPFSRVAVTTHWAKALWEKPCVPQPSTLWVGRGYHQGEAQT